MYCLSTWKEQLKLLDWISRSTTERQEAIVEKDNWGRQKAVVLTDRCEKIEPLRRLFTMFSPCFASLKYDFKHDFKQI